LKRDKKKRMIHLFRELVLILSLIKVCEFVSPSDNLDEYYIISNITTGYKQSIRPSSQLPVTIKLSLKTISAIDEKNLVMTSDSYFTGNFFKELSFATQIN
jgi:hypothetical protein